MTATLKLKVNKWKRTLSGILHDVLYHLPQHLPFKMAAKQSRTTTLTKCTCKACLVVNHPEIALTLEKCIIQGKITWIEHFFYELCTFSWYLQVNYYKSNKGEPIDGKLIDWSDWNIDEIERYPQGCILRFRAILPSGFPEPLTPPSVRFSSMPSIVGV